MHALTHSNVSQGSSVAFGSVSTENVDGKLIARATAFAARLARAGSRFADEPRLIQHINSNPVDPALPPASMRTSLLRRLTGCKIYTVAPRSSQAKGRVIFHDGGYVGPILGWHWRFIARMAQRLDLPFTIPMYPLAPAHAVFFPKSRIARLRIVQYIHAHLADSLFSPVKPRLTIGELSPNLGDGRGQAAA
jgi:acetyl esterase/lipase